MKDRARLEVCLRFGTVERDDELEGMGLCMEDKMMVYMDIWLGGAAA